MGPVERERQPVDGGDNLTVINPFELELTSLRD